MISTALGNFAVTLTGDVHGVNHWRRWQRRRRGLLAPYWRHSQLPGWWWRWWAQLRPHRGADAASVCGVGRGAQRDGVRHFSACADLRGKDELGILASCLHDLLQRVNGMCGADTCARRT